jgi:hypothetical protein
VVSQPCDTVNRRRLALRQDCDLMHTVSDSPRVQDNAMDLCTGISGAPLLASLRYAGCCRSTGPCKVILLMGCTVTNVVARGRWCYSGESMLLGTTSHEAVHPTWHITQESIHIKYLNTFSNRLQTTKSETTYRLNLGTTCPSIGPSYSLDAATFGAPTPQTLLPPVFGRFTTF